MTCYCPSCRMLEHVAFVDALPFATSRKVRRAGLRALAAALVGQPEYFDLTAMKKRTT